MHVRRRRRPHQMRVFVPGVSYLATLALVLSILSILPAQARQRPEPPAASSGFAPTISESLRNDISRPLSSVDVAQIKPAAERSLELPMHRLPKATESSGGASPASSGSRAVQAAAPAGSMPAFDNTFEGVGNLDSVLPPDTEGDVGPNNYVQWVNLHLAVYDRDGNILLGPIPGNAIWDGFGGPCETNNDGDPIVQYDQLADRWMISQFALFTSDGNHQCIAVSQTGDPTGAYFRYDFLISATKINDYPHFGVWPDAYYMSINQFDQNTFAWAGQGAVAFEREQMLQGLPARMVYFDLFGVDPNFGGQQPSDLDGFPPPDGTPNMFVEVDDDAFGFPTDRLSMWEFHVDWSNPANSTFGIGGQPNTSLDTAPFDANLCGFDRNCIPQPGTSQGLDAISDRLMYRLQYRTFADHTSLVVNHTVDVDGSDRAGIRWYELRNDGSGWSIFQQGTYAPDSDNRWMGSAAMDASGDIAIGYSVSSETTFPSIRAAGRLVNDPLGELSQGESEMFAGTGSQTHPAARWGDYSMLAVDPVDQCTYWYTNEYLVDTSSADWHTRIGHFKFPSCTLGPSGTLTGTVTNADTGDPIEGATVNAGPVTTHTAADGTYTFTLPVGTYDMTVTSYGFGTGTANGVEVVEDQTTTQDFALQPVPAVHVTGTVTDGSGHGWPLYARIDIDGYPGGPVFTDPVTGQFSVDLVQQTDFTYHVNAVSGGYVEATRDANYGSDTASEDFSLEVDQQTCDAPGYAFQTDGVFEQFDTGQLPDGWTVQDNLGNGQVWAFDDPNNRGNLTGGADGFAIVDSDFYGPGGTQDTSLLTPVLDLSSVASPIIRFNTDYFDFDPTPEIADVDLSVDGGGTWENVWRQTTSVRGPALVELPIPQAANDADVQVRFHYYQAAFSWWWQVDDVVVGGEPTCSPLDGGLVVGNVYDQVTGDPLNGARVTSDDQPDDTVLAGPTPDDPGLDEGFYLLFSSLTGQHPFTASKANFGDSTATVDVAADGVVRQDFQLGSGNLVVDPSSLEVTVQLGETANGTVTVTNNGTADATFEIRERDLGSDILGQTGTRLTRVIGDFPSGPLANAPKGSSAPKRFAATTPGGNAKVEPPPNEPPWVGIADYPFGVMDNVADTWDGKVYAVSGIDTSLSSVDDLLSYDPSTSSWSELAPISIPRERPNGAIIDGKFYVVGGWDQSGNTVDTLEIYDIDSDTWSTGASIPTAWAASSNVVLDGKLYLIGGCQFDCGSTDVWVYDPGADAWSQAADYPESISWTHCGAIDGLIYCAGGTAGSSTTAHGYAYDPSADAWSPIADMPQDQWAGGYVAANGQLIVSGGVTDGFSTLTNEGFAYDPASDSWSSIPNSNNTLYRGASACGFYRIGGSIGGFAPVPDSELLPGLEDCGAVVDVTWLSEDPVTATVPAGGSVDVAVGFDASVPEVVQPGTYLAELNFKTDTPHAVPPVPVTMDVTPPPDWGKVQGTVVGLERCDAPGDPLANASVHVDGAIDDFDLETAADGTFEWWLDAANSPLTLTVSKDGWVTQDRSGVVVTAGNVTTEDFSLRLDAPCAEASPESLDVTVGQGQSATTPLTLSNDPAAASYDFQIDETPFALDPLGPSESGGGEGDEGFSLPAPVGPESVRSQTLGKTPTVPSPDIPGWFGGNDLPGGIVRYAHAQCDGDADHLYVFGGVDGGFNLSDGSWVYSASQNQWTELAPMPAGQEGPTAVCEGGKIYVLGGGGTNQFFIYDIGSDTWSVGAPLPRPVWGAAAGAFNGKVYLIGGDSDFFFGGTSNEVDVYDVATDTWTGTGASMPRATVAAGFADAGRYVYIVGGWDDASPAANVNATQRYDLVTDTWETGPTFDGARSDFALAATDAALYAIGGDEDGGSAFDASQSSDRLALDAWPGGSWSSLEDLPIGISANSGGYCTTSGVFGGEAWSVGGADLFSFGITGRTFFRDAGGEGCPSIRADVPWLSEDPTSGTVDADSSLVVDVTVDATDLQEGEYDATLLISTSDPAHSEMRVPVHVTVGPADETPPSCEQVQRLRHPPRSILEVQDLESGLASIVVVGTDNATVTVPEFEVGTTDPVQVTITKASRGGGWNAVIDVTDVAGNVTTCDSHGRIL